jgi:hypothetical protein
MTFLPSHGVTIVYSLQLINQSTITVSQAYLTSSLASAEVYSGIRAQPNVAMDTSFNNGLNSAILRYVGANATEPSKNHTSPGPLLLETNLHVGAFRPFHPHLLNKPLLPPPLRRWRILLP